MNYKSIYYKSNWEQVNLRNPNQTSYGFSLGVTKKLATNFQFNISGRWQKWGGDIYIENPDPSDNYKMELNYKSISIPVLLQYSVVNRPKFACFLGLGAGVDVTYHEKQIATNFFGRLEQSERDLRIYTPFLNLGGSVEYKPKESNDLRYVAGFTLLDDHLFSPKRTNDLGYFLWTEIIPVYSTILTTFVGIKL